MATSSPRPPVRFACATSSAAGSGAAARAAYSAKCPAANQAVSPTIAAASAVSLSRSTALSREKIRASPVIGSILEKLNDAGFSDAWNPPGMPLATTPAASRTAPQGTTIHSADCASPPSHCVSAAGSTACRRVKTSPLRTSSRVVAPMRGPNTISPSSAAPRTNACPTSRECGTLPSLRALSSLRCDGANCLSSRLVSLSAICRGRGDLAPDYFGTPENSSEEKRADGPPISPSPPPVRDSGARDSRPGLRPQLQGSWASRAQALPSFCMIFCNFSSSVAFVKGLTM